MKNIRAHDEYNLIFDDPVTLIIGANGSGKTSLLEAVHIALQGSSFRDSDNAILSFDAPWYRIDLELGDNQARTVKFDPNRSTGKKQFVIDNKTHYRLTNTYKYPVVLFEPDELRLISGSPSRRREFIDRFICQFDPEYALSLRRYERALKQRNMLLKKSIQRDDLFVWDVSLSKYGAYLIVKRIEIIQQITPKLSSIYKSIARSKDEIVLEYSSPYQNSIEQRLLSELHQSADRDRILGYTSIGPHRHDLQFYLNGAPAVNTASRGEIRTIILALKFVEVDILEAITGRKPIILLDDVFSELDEKRQQALLKRFKNHQTIITSVSSSAANFPVHRLSR